MYVMSFDWMWDGKCIFVILCFEGVFMLRFLVVVNELKFWVMCDGVSFLWIYCFLFEFFDDKVLFEYLLMG